MSLTLGEKLRQAREDRGFTISQVSEQTRISPLYLESIENDDYGILPGGIFNKGFVKSYAKFVGVNEQEALLDYSRQIAVSEGSEDGELRKYKPEVLTDDGGVRSMIPTVIVAVLILGAMTAAILFGVNYWRRQSDAPLAIQTANINSNSVTSTQTNSNTNVDNSAIPNMEALKVEFRALGQPVSLTSTVDGKTGTSIVTPGAAATFEPKISLKLSYSRSLANFVQLTINGKQIAVPAAPLEPKRGVIAFEINNENLEQIWTSGAISAELPPATAEAGTEPVAPPVARTTSAPKPSPAATAATVQTLAPKPTSAPRLTPRPPIIVGRPPANRPQ